MAINKFNTDTKTEIDLIRRKAVDAGAQDAVVSEVWAKGSEGGRELACAVVRAAGKKHNFKFLYPLDMKLRDRVEKIAQVVYGADGVSWTADA